MHYKRQWRHGDPMIFKKIKSYKGRSCLVSECAKEVKSNGFCIMHDARFRKYGDANTVKRISGENRSSNPTYKSYYGMIQRVTSDSPISYANYKGRSIKVCFRWLGLNGYTHFVSDMGERPYGLTLDRIDNDGDYEPTNCRWATPQQQVLNRRIFKNNTSGHQGVYWRKDGQYWTASISRNYKMTNLGRFATKEEAIKARETAEQQMAGV